MHLQMNGSVAFCALVSGCGLSSMFAGHSMARAVRRAGIAPETMLHRDVPTVLPEVERAIRPFLDPQELSRVLADLHAWW